MTGLESFALGWAVSLGWAIMIVPIILLKVSTRLPLD